MNSEKDYRHGHRERLRQRLLKAGRQAFADYELLELLLTYAIPRKDTKPIAKRLLKQFGSFTAVLDQPKERLLEIDGVGQQTCTFLLVIREFMVRYLEQEVEYAKTISTPDDITDFVRAHLGSAPRECLMILYLNDANRLAYHNTITKGTVDRASFYPREILKTAFLRDATGLIMVHNHPSGDPIPSENDHKITQQLENLASEFNIKVHDHLIVTPHKAFSLKTGRLL